MNVPKNVAVLFSSSYDELCKSYEHPARGVLPKPAIHSVYASTVFTSTSGSHCAVNGAPEATY